MNDMLDITFWQLLSAYVFIVILLVIVRWRKIPREKEILIASIRMTLQLVLVGYLLTYVFENVHVVYSIAILVVMEVFAVHNIFSRSKLALSRELKKVIALSMVTGTLVTIIYFDFIVIHFSPWYDPRYLIPIAGMIIGNSMTGITLGVSSLVEGFKSNKHLVESALMLGATPNVASKKIVNHAFDSAILPTINSMVGMGIVFLPGMMTGVILSGASPLDAIKYQIAIMLGVTGSVSLTVILFLYFGYKTFFNKEAQMKN
ncbi:ABC transporter permease [Aquibacillus rhizosphaerae]|uniref:Iron export ABC transporter permease subunit FetB n=1 Tax=Aquibacillus rhizosphaerae TaxID=3051431 RepID=A0ABT7LAJ7_9BACI|nr:iron export ABC transporter permease subunit FetB [Aquibacillus sp. LR5S19]MDL4842287.1 iron export ABC transporter permease subunit FetB [Aquibacillus sp. LR5S19]